MAKKSIKRENIKEKPDFLKNKGKKANDAYQQWLEIGEKIQNHPKRWITVRDVGFEDVKDIDCLQSPMVVKRNIIHLTKEEQQEVWDNWGEIQKLKIKKGQLKRLWDNIIYKKQGNVHFIDLKQTELIELFGKWKRVDEVKEIVEKEWGYIVTIPKLRQFFEANKEKIEELRNEWSNKYMDYSLAHKRGRVEMLAHIANTQYDKYKKDGKYSIAYSRECRAALEQIKKEIEGENISLNINGQVDVRQTLLINQSINDITQKVNINSFIVALVAAKRGLDAGKFMNKLASSYYSTYTGFKQERGESDEEIQHPSKLIYNWKEIEERHSRDKEQEGDYVDYETVTDEDETRKILREKLKARQKRLGEIK